MSPLWLYSADGDEYQVGRAGVEDWDKQLPTSAGIPAHWEPTSYYSRGQSNISGYNYQDGEIQEIPIGREVRAELPFEVLVSASTTS